MAFTVTRSHQTCFSRIPHSYTSSRDSREASSLIARASGGRGRRTKVASQIFSLDLRQSAFGQAGMDHLWRSELDDPARRPVEHVAPGERQRPAVVDSDVGL